MIATGWRIQPNGRQLKRRAKIKLIAVVLPERLRIDPNHPRDIWL
jgi:hypothetical protein